MGTVFAGQLAGALGRIGAARVAEHTTVVRHYGLPTALPSGVAAHELISLMRRDKKAENGLTFVLDSGKGVGLVPDVPEEVVAATLAAMPRQSPADITHEGDAHAWRCCC